MTRTKTIKEIIREHKTVFVIIAVVLFLLELEIFAVAVMKSGRKSTMQVIDTRGNVIHETDGNNLSEFNKYYFEKTFGPLDQYQVKLVTRENPFPFRGWFVAAVGLPVGIVLLFGFIVKAYAALFYDDKHKAMDIQSGSDQYESRLEKVVARVSRLNIFTIGFLIFLAVFGYWVIPNFTAYLGRIGIETLVRFKWFFTGAAVLMMGIVVWIIYLRYRLAVKTIETQAEVEKHRLQLELDNRPVPAQLTYDNQMGLLDKGMADE